MTTATQKSPEQDRIEREAAKAALAAIGQDWAMVICGECGQIGCEGHRATVSPALKAASLIGLAMMTAR